MSASTGLVVTAGALVLVDKLLDPKPLKPADALKGAVATVIAAYVSAGLDKIAPGFGTGAAVVLVVGVVLRVGPRIGDRIMKS